MAARIVGWVAALVASLALWYLLFRLVQGIARIVTPY